MLLKTMKINVSIEILSDDQQKEQAVAAAREIVGKVLDRFKPGGVVEPQTVCPECKALYGAHREDCSKAKPFRGHVVAGLEREVKIPEDTAVRDRAQIQRLQAEVARLAELCKTYHVPTE